MSDFTKSAKIAAIVWTDLADGDVAESSEITVSDYLWANFFVTLARRSATGYTTLPILAIEGSSSASGDDNWIELARHTFPAGSSLTRTQVNQSAGIAADATSFDVDSVSNYAAGDLLLVEGDTAAEHEIVRIESISSNTLTVVQPFTYGHSDNAYVCNGVEQVSIPVDIAAVHRLRCVYINATGQAAAIRIDGVTLNAFA